MHFFNPFPKCKLVSPLPSTREAQTVGGTFEAHQNTTGVYFHSGDAGCCGLKCRPEAEGHGSLWLSLLSVQELLPSQRINSSALCFPCREWNLPAVHAASPLRMSVEKLKPWTQAQTRVLAWSHSALQIYSWRLQHRLALSVDGTFAMRPLGFYHANICSVGTLPGASCGS